MNQHGNHLSAGNLVLPINLRGSGYKLFVQAELASPFLHRGGCGPVGCSADDPYPSYQLYDPRLVSFLYRNFIE